MAIKPLNVTPPVMQSDAPDWALRFGDDTALAIRVLLAEIATLKTRLQTAGIA